MPLYFAYGSCMHIQDLQRTEKKAWLYSTAVLQDYRLAYSSFSSNRKGGVADIVESPGSRVEGMLYVVSNFIALDIREGHPFVYQRIKLPVFIEGQGSVMVTTYEVRFKNQGIEYPPSSEYFNLIREGSCYLTQKYRRELEEHYDEVSEKGNKFTVREQQIWRY